MARPPHTTVLRHALVAALVVMILVLIGTFARDLYIVIVHPRRDRVMPEHESPLTLALGLGLAAGVIEAVFAYSGIRERHCRDYAAAAKTQADDLRQR